MIEILGWQEKGDGKRTKGPLPWIHLHTDPGLGYCRLIQKHGAMGWGVWCGLLMEVSRYSQEKRGVFRGSPEDLALVTRIPESEVLEVLPTLEAIGWARVTLPGKLLKSLEISGDSLPRGEERRGEEKRREETPSPKLAKEPTPEGVALAQHLYDEICSHTPDFKADEKKLLGWAKIFDVELRKKDGFTDAEMRQVITWAHRHESRGFWHGNLLSATKVRKHAQTLLIDARKGGSAGGRGMSVKDLLSDDIDFPEVIR